MSKEPSLEIRYIRTSNECELFWLKAGDIFMFEEKIYLKLESDPYSSYDSGSSHNVFNFTNKNPQKLDKMKIVRRLKAELIITETQTA